MYNFPSSMLFEDNEPFEKKIILVKNKYTDNRFVTKLEYDNIIKKNNNEIRKNKLKKINNNENNS